MKSTTLKRANQLLLFGVDVSARLHRSRDKYTTVFSIAQAPVSLTKLDLGPGGVSVGVLIRDVPGRAGATTAAVVDVSLKDRFRDSDTRKRCGLEDVEAEVEKGAEMIQSFRRDE
ncbi:hypothetical protein EVAR_49393_1 [Eumeta japonica]|uniref:Uncharacterized protein n=1 Tax=Eumeta variegata TaxID=151549 RepID=A0A4C1YQL8_EUMVA|nr:hypothetical protein EVAR_49393_1 [Eumeta japonica]